MGRRWQKLHRLVYLSAGLGVACLNEASVGPGMVRLGAAAGLPALQDVEFHLLPPRRGESPLVRMHFGSRGTLAATITARRACTLKRPRTARDEVADRVAGLELRGKLGKGLHDTILSIPDRQRLERGSRTII